jgi:Tol biopolymer transport system component
MNIRRPASRPLGRAVVAAIGLSLLCVPPARAQFIPYYGKNKVKYDNFAWRIYKSPHFEVFYYPEFEQHLARVTSYLESAYQKLSAGLKHEISAPVPAILYKTHSEFEQTNLFPTFVPEGVLAFAEPLRGRLVLPIDEPPDRLQGLITHEMTHVFEFDIIPRMLGYGVVQRPIPLWIDEGLADYFRGTWDPLDLMMIRDAAVTDHVPKLSKAEFEAFSGRLVYNMGHAAFEFMEARYGKEGIRQFLYTLRKGILGGSTEDIYKQAFRITPEEFDEAFDKWLKERFKPYRDKQRPSDYGRDLSPNSEKTPYTQVFGFSPSPSGEMVAAVTANRAEGEADIVLLSARDGSVIRNLTKGFSGTFENLSFNENFVAGRTIAFDTRGDGVAFFGRVGKGRSYFEVSVLSGKIRRKVPVALDLPESPCPLPDGRRALFAALKEGISDIYLLDLETGATTNLTSDAYADSDPQISPDGRLVVYTRHFSGHDKIFVFPLDDPAHKTQLTFGPFDDSAPIFSPDGTRIYYSSNEDDDIYNVRSLDLKTGVIEQYTDVLGGNMAPAALHGKTGDRLAFISYFKGEYRLQSKELAEPAKEVDQEVRPAAEGIADFQPDVVHQVIPENKRRKKLFEGLYLEGRPPLNVGVTSNGDFFGGTQVALTDVLGDQDLLLTVASVREFRTYAGTYINLASRLHYGITGFDYTQFYYPSYLIPTVSFSRAGAIATERYTGASLIAQYPFDKFRRLDFSAGFLKLQQQYANADVQAQVEALAAAQGVPFFLYDGTLVPLSLSFTQETTRFAEFGPLSGDTFSLGVEVAPSIGNSLSRQTFEVDARKYLRLGSTSALLATRARGFYSTGSNPGIFYFGGNMELRGYDYLSFVGNQGFFADAELRLPLINLMATPIGVLGPVRGTLYGGVGYAKFKGQPTSFATSQSGTSYVNYDPNDITTLAGEPVNGFHLVDGRASFGFGLQLFFLGYPLHFDWSKQTDLKVVSNHWRFDFWVGFDF